MALREELIRRIDKKRKEINELDAKLKAATSYLQALEDMFRLIPLGEEPETEAPAAGQIESVLRTGSKTDRARDFLRAAGQPLHILKILEGMGEKTDNESRAALAGSLGAYARDGKIFTRTAPNTFGLIEFQETKPAPTTPVEIQPPEGFGSDEPPNGGDKDTPW